MAVASISMRRSGLINRLTSTIEEAGRMFSKNSACAFAACSQLEISVTYILVRVTSAIDDPACVKIFSILLSMKCVWA